MVAGSFASTAHGLPRTTQDLDLVVDPPRSAELEALLASIPANEYYVDADTARDAFRRRSMFNLIDLASGWKVDLVVRKDRPFSREEFARRVKMSKREARRLWEYLDNLLRGPDPSPAVSASASS